LAVSAKHCLWTPISFVVVEVGQWEIILAELARLGRFAAIVLVHWQMWSWEGLAAQFTVNGLRTTIAFMSVKLGSGKLNLAEIASHWRVAIGFMLLQSVDWLLLLAESAWCCAACSAMLGCGWTRHSFKTDRAVVVIEATIIRVGSGWRFTSVISDGRLVNLGSWLLVGSDVNVN